MDAFLVITSARTAAAGPVTRIMAAITVVVIEPVIVVGIVIIITSVPIIGTPVIIAVIIVKRIPHVTAPDQAVTMISGHLVVLGGLVVVIDDNLPGRVRDLRRAFYLLAYRRI
jgi:fatty acid desaturase